MPFKGNKKLNTLVGLLFAGAFVFGVFISTFIYARAPKGTETRALALATDNQVDVSLSDTDSKDISVGTDLLGKAELSYAGGTEGRNKNIELGVQRINGKVVLPGQEFSFAKAIGVVTAEDGYSEEKIFLNGEVTKGLGGGLCQVSTTLFRSVLDAGLQVTERHNHSYTVSRYDVGLDATYADPGPDFKFKNDSVYPVEIKGKTEGQKVVFELYGTRDGRVASTTEPEILSVVDFPPTKYIATSTKFRDGQECFNTPQIGYTAKIVYSVLYPDGVLKQHDFISKYKPLQRVCYIGLNM